jgi:hypothetical protein
MKQKSRKNWLNLGDQNTAYFHSLVRIRQARNLMICLKNEEGVRFEDPQQFKDMAI